MSFSNLKLNLNSSKFYLLDNHIHFTEASCSGLCQRQDTVLYCARRSYRFDLAQEFLLLMSFQRQSAAAKPLSSFKKVAVGKNRHGAVPDVVLQAFTMSGTY